MKINFKSNTMYDFYKSYYKDPNYSLPKDKADYFLKVNEETGEVDGKKTAEYCELKITKHKSDRVLISGSLHKFYNETDFNGDDYNINNFENTLLRLQTELELDPKLCKLENLEIGLNIQLDFNPDCLLKNLLFHRSKGFNRPISGAFYYQSEKRRYIVKIYNKTAQYNNKLQKLKHELNNATDKKEKEKIIFLKETISKRLKPNILRFELKFIKMQGLKDLGVSDIETLGDLIKPDVLTQLKAVLIKEFNEVVFYDYTTKESLMKQSEIINLKDYKNPNFWNELNSKSKLYHKKQFEKYTQKYSLNTKQIISNLLRKKFEQLNQKV